MSEKPMKCDRCGALTHRLIGMETAELNLHRQLMDINDRLNAIESRQREAMNVLALVEADRKRLLGDGFTGDELSARVDAILKGE